jgi:cold shock CspA family protein
MKKQGTVIRWDDERGFGFIRSPQTSADIFFHIRDFRGADPAALRIGLAVTFEEVHVGGKGPRAVAVQDGSARAAAPSARAAPGAQPHPVLSRQRARPARHRPQAPGSPWF